VIDQPLDGSRRRIALRIEYDGTEYLGSQLQSAGPTIQGELERALNQFTRTFTRIYMAGRTDTGVHALGQVAAFSTSAPYPSETCARALNARLPGDIRVRAAYEVAADFDPRRDARSRTYCYAILNRDEPSSLLRRFTHHLAKDLSVEVMDGAARELEGQLDVASFSGSLDDGRTSIRAIHRCRVVQRGDLVLLLIKASAFLQGQVRRTAGMLTQVGIGRLSIKEFRKIRDAATPGLAGPALPAKGLCLLAVEYQSLPAVAMEGWPPGNLAFPD
jgi:tRNA pseudouridine38-40 synthase